MSVLQRVRSSVPEDVFGVKSKGGSEASPVVRRAAAAKEPCFARLSERSIQVSEGHRRAAANKSLRDLTERPNILGCLLPKSHWVRLVQLKQTGVVLLAKNFRLFAVGILETRWKLFRQERLE